MSSSGGSAKSGRGGGVGLALGAVAVIVALSVVGVLNQNTQTKVAFDPGSTSPSGTKALVELVGALGGSVDVPDHFPVDADVAVLFQDIVPATELEKVHKWVREGHTLVVTDPFSDFTPASRRDDRANSVPSLTVDRGVCTIDALSNVGRINRGLSGGYDANFASVQGPVCFANADGAFLTLTSEGAGQIVSMSQGLLFTNAYLGLDDNAVLAADLFAPRPGYRFAVLGQKAFGSGSGDGGGGDQVGSLSKLMNLGIRLFLIELALAVVVYGLARGRRLGRPVGEPQPVQIAGSELVSAVGNLLQQTRAPANAAAVLRADVRRQLCDRLGVLIDIPSNVLGEMVAQRSGRSLEEVVSALFDQQIQNEGDLVALAKMIDVIREEVLHGQRV